MFDSVDDTDILGASRSWLAIGSEAMAPYLLDDKWQWIHCSVLSFDTSTNKYRVRFSHNGLEKSVKRFNLLFDAESRETWQTCRANAKEAREATKRRLRFDYFVSQQPMEEVRAVQGSTIRRIHEKVVDGLPLDVKFPSQETPMGNLVRDLTKQVIQQHTRSMKKSILFCKLKLSEAERERYSCLGLPPVPGPISIPWLAKVDTPEYPYRERRKAIGNIHYSTLPEVLRALLWLQQVWQRTFLQERLVDTGLEALELPCKVEDFCEIEARCCTRLEERLAQDWRRAFSEQLVDSLQDVYYFFQNDAQLYHSSALFRLLKHVELRMRSQLRILFIDSLMAWRQFVGKNTPDPTEMDLQAPGSTPLFDIRLKVVTGGDGKSCISIVPGLAAIEHALLRVVDGVVTAVKALATIDTDIMSLLHLSSRCIFNVEAGDETYADVESMLDETKTYTRNQVMHGMQGAHHLGEKFNKYCYLMTTDTEEFMYSFTEAAPAPTDDEYFEKVRELHDASVAIGEYSPERELFKLARVDSSEATKCLENQLLNMSCMESGDDIHLERTTGCQPNVTRLDNNGELSAQVRATASSVTEGSLPTHERWYLNHFA